MRKALPTCLKWDDFVHAWHPRDLLLVSRKSHRDRAQVLMFQHHKVAYPNEPVPLLYRPMDTRRQNIMVTIPGPLTVDRPDQEQLVKNDVVPVSIQTAQEVLDGKWGGDWALGYAMTIHSSQGLTIENPKKVWIIDDRIEWSNLVYLAVSRVQYLHQLARCSTPPDLVAPGPERDVPTLDDERKNIGRKLHAYKRTDFAKGLRNDLRAHQVRALKELQHNRCAACNIELLWAYQPKDPQQFSVDRLDNAKGHTHDNVRLTCLECNTRRGAAALNA